MSISKNQDLAFWKDVLTQLRRTEITWQGSALSGRDYKTHTEAILCAALVTSDLSNRYEGFGSCDEISAWALFVASIDISTLAHLVSDSVAVWRSCQILRLPVSECLEGFKRLLRYDDSLIENFIHPIRGAIIAFACDPSPLSFYPVYQFFCFLTHLSLNDINQDAALEREYLDRELKVSQHTTPDWFVETLNGIMKEWLADFRLNEENFSPKHGPGAIQGLSGDRSKFSKYQRLTPSASIVRAFKEHAGLDAYSYVPSFPIRFPDGVTLYIPLVEQLYRDDTTSEIVFVPKSMKTKRTISKEPATLQYFQQGVCHAITTYVHRHPYLSRHIDLRKQELSRDMAIEASQTRRLSTVDLSAASDSLSLDLVERVFNGTTLEPYLVPLRSTSTKLPSGKVVSMAKFAPMGSALCFPIETLVFACIVEATERYVAATMGLDDSRWLVYGDDIILSDLCYTDLVTNLRFAGFTVNEDKSYTGSVPFRESCGMHAFDGEDVTPLIISRRFSSERCAFLSPHVFAGRIDMCNSAARYGFSALRHYLIDSIINDHGRTPLFSEDPNSGVYSPTPNNYRASTRWNADYQKEEIHVHGIHSFQPSLASSLTWKKERNFWIEDEPGLYAEDFRYFEWLRSTRNRTTIPFYPDFRVEVSVGSSTSYLCRHWTDKPV